ncbi:MAG: sodium:alanine symporter family protein, partial [Anaerotignum sp.]|nr:sodium:alanine symporter family protein [Anaerotignum sp.]
MSLMYTVYDFLWADLITIPLPNGGSLGLSLLVLMLVPAGIYFTIRSRFLQVRLFPEMLRMTLEKKASNDKNSLSGLQALIVSTATRVGMGNLAGVVSAISM